MSAPTVSTHGILHPTSGGRHFDLLRREPSPDLAPFVERHWRVRWDLRGRERFVQQVLPHPCVNLAFERGRSYVYGVGTRRAGHAIEGAGQVFGTKFRPGGFLPFVGRPLSDLTGRTVSPREVFDIDVAAVEHDVLATSDIDEQIAIVEAVLRAVSPRPDPVIAQIGEICRLAMGEREITHVEDLAARVRLSPRSLQRLFRRYVGVSPKFVIRQYRIHEAVARLSDGQPVDWAALSQDLGYFDQAHFNRDFKALVGQSPGEYAARRAQ